MAITQTRVKQFSSTWKHVVSVDGTPVAVTRSAKRAGMIASYLEGYDVEITDGALKRQLDKYRKQK